MSRDPQEEDSSTADQHELPLNTVVAMIDEAIGSDEKPFEFSERHVDLFRMRVSDNPSALRFAEDLVLGFQKVARNLAKYPKRADQIAEIEQALALIEGAQAAQTHMQREMSWLDFRSFYFAARPGLQFDIRRLIGTTFLRVREDLLPQSGDLQVMRETFATRLSEMRGNPSTGGAQTIPKNAQLDYAITSMLWSVLADALNNDPDFPEFFEAELYFEESTEPDQNSQHEKTVGEDDDIEYNYLGEDLAFPLSSVEEFKMLLQTVNEPKSPFIWLIAFAILYAVDGGVGMPEKYEETARNWARKARKVFCRSTGVQIR